MKIPTTIFTSSNWHNHSHNPIIQPHFPNTILADPCVIPPGTSSDGNWHLFCHTAVGLNHYTSPDGFAWTIHRNLFLPLAFRPYIYIEKSTFYLLFERPSGLHKFPFYDSKIMLCQSSDLVHWSKPVDLLRPSLPWHSTANKHHNIGNPCLIKIGRLYHLYYTTGLTHIKDYNMCEPTITSVATSNHLLGPYVFHPKPISTSPTAGASTRIYKFQNLLLGLQTTFSFHPHKTSSVIRLITSTNGLKWRVASKPLITTDQPWKASHIYVGDLVRHRNQLRIYYNARYGNFFSPEALGVSIFHPNFSRRSHKQTRTPSKRVLRFINQSL